MKKTFPVPCRARPGTIDDFPKALYNKEDCLFPLEGKQGGLNAIVVLGIDPGYALMSWGVGRIRRMRVMLSRMDSLKPWWGPLTTLSVRGWDTLRRT